MTYREAINRLYDLQRHAMEPGLERTAALLSALGDPHEDLDVIQIAGTNGKGSTAAMTAEILRAHGLDVGLYTSPHLEGVRERIQVDGHWIAETAVAAFVDRLEETLAAPDRTADSPTFFEAVTAMALWYFERQGVDVAVVEAGLGGRHDATSVVDPVSTAVTAVALDHTDVLGETVEEITRDKAAIAGANVPLVTGADGRPREFLRELHPHATVVGTDDAADVHVAYDGVDDHLEAGMELTGEDWNVTTASPLLGEKQAVNAGVAAALARSRWSVDAATVARGIRGVHWPGRTEVLGRDPLVLLDGAHNPDACAHIVGVLDELAYDRLHLVVGVLADKDVAAMCEQFPADSAVTVCRPDTPRGADPRDLQRCFERGGAASVERIRSVEAALSSALERAAPGDCVCVTGSLYTVAEARHRLKRRLAVTPVPTIEAADRALERAHVTDRGIDHMRAKGVHRVVHARVTQRQAGYLKQELLSRGGECAVSGVHADGEYVDVLMMGTLQQLAGLAAGLADQSVDLPAVGRSLRRAVGLAGDDTVDERPWATPPAVMGVVNVTPDSFYDGGEWDDPEVAIDHARSLVEAGAAIVDIGGESTRPGGDPVPADAERERVLPVIEALADLEAWVSIDTKKADVAADAVDAGADLINDVSGLSDPAMAATAADHDVPIVVAHAPSAPVERGLPIEYSDVVRDVSDHLADLVTRCQRAGIDRRDVVVDPGLGFNKRPATSFELVRRIGELRALGCPVLVGHSQKSMFDHIGYGAGDRDAPTHVTAAYAAMQGAAVVRVHDVAPTVAAIDTIGALTDRR